MNLYFKHKGLRKFFETGSRRGIDPKHAKKLRFILARLATATRLEEMYVPAFNLHQLQGDKRGAYAVSVSGNWRVTFKVEGDNAVEIDLLDYH